MTDTEKFTGQWLGVIDGTNSGQVMLGVDPDRPGIGCIQADDPLLPFAVDAVFEVKGSDLRGRLTNFMPQGLPAEPDIQLPQSGEIYGHLEKDEFTGTWKTDGGTHGAFVFLRAEDHEPIAADQTMSWNEFREWAFRECSGRGSLIFRGQKSSTYPLATSFHRTGRRNLFRYANDDVFRLCRSVEAVVGKPFNLQDPVDHGALLNLAQHHGFPTPLLDWTESPFVAAFFAFCERRKRENPNDERIRVFVFDFNGWPEQRVETIGHIRPASARLYLRARENPRLLPQQSVHMFSNIAAIEEFVSKAEGGLKTRFLRRIDIPASDRPMAMSDLDAMGITAASLYPGLEGLCRALSEKWF